LRNYLRIIKFSVFNKKLGDFVYLANDSSWSWIAGKAEGKPDASFSFVDPDFISVASGKMNPQMAFIR